MGIPKSTVLVGHFGLEGKLPQECISDVLASNYFRSWLFLLSSEDESNPEVIVKGAGLEYANIPLHPPAGLTDDAAQSIIDCLHDLPKPTMIQCSSGARASAALSLYLQEKAGLPNVEVLELAKLLGLPFLQNEHLVKWVGRWQCGTTHKLIFRQLFDEKSCTYTYLLGDPETRKAVIIDPVLEKVERDAEVVRELELDLQYAINTHCHADHVTGTGSLKKMLPELKSGIAATSGASADILFSPGDSVNIGKHSLTVKATPGHTNGCLSYYTESNGGMVFTGDALLIRGCGRTDFQEGDSGTLYESIHDMIFTLPDRTTVYPGHDYKGRTCSSIWEEKKYNPRLTKSKNEFIEIMGSLNLSPPRMIDVAVPANLVCGIQD